MNDFKEIFKSSLDCIKTENDIVQNALQRMKKRSPIRRLAPIISGAIAAVLLCTLTVSAVKLGWLNVILGESAQDIAANNREYSVGITDLILESNVPGAEITLDEIYSDGNVVLINVNFSGLSEEAANLYSTRTNALYNFYDSKGNDREGLSGIHFYETVWEEGSLGICTVVSLADVLSVDDRVEYLYFDRDLHSSGEYGSSWTEEMGSWEFRMSFTVSSVPPYKSVTLTPTEPLTFYSELWGGCKTTADVNSITFTPLSYRISGQVISTNIHPVDATKAVFDASPVTLIMNDGSRINLSEFSEGGGGSGGGGYFEGYFSFHKLLPIDDLAGIEIGDSYIEVNK